MNTSPTDNRNYGIDLLKIVSMIFIPLLHVLGQGGILSGSTPLSAHYETAWFLEVAAYCAVNCYAIISGYVSYGSRYKYSSIAYLSLQVLFYTLTTTGIFMIVMPDVVNTETIWQAFFPFAYNSVNWYFAAYFCMFFFIPYMNLFMEKATRKTARNLIIVIVVFLSVIPTLFQSDVYKLTDGYSVFWLMALYFIGAYIKKYSVGDFIGPARSALAYFICVIVTWAVKWALEASPDDVLENVKSNILVSYTSPTILLAGVMLFLCFRDLKIGAVARRIISFFAPCTFGVYLIHAEPLTWKYVMRNRFVGYLEQSPLVMALYVIGTAVAIWLACSLIDRVRYEIFRVFRVKKALNKAEDALRSRLSSREG